MPTVTLVIKEETDRRLREAIKTKFGDVHGVKKRLEESALNLMVDYVCGMNLEERAKWYIDEIEKYLKDGNDKKTLEKPTEIIVEPIKEPENLPQIPRSSEPEVREVSFASLEEEQTIEIKPGVKLEEIKQVQPVQVKSKNFAEYDNLSYEQLIESKAKFTSFTTEEDNDRYQYIIKKIVDMKRTW